MNDKQDLSLEQIRENMEEISEQLGEDIKESNGFNTKTGQYIDRAEWHASMLGFAPISLGYILPTPMGELFIIAELAMLRTGFNKKMRDKEISGHLGDVMEEIAYTFGFSFLAAVVFELLIWQFNLPFGLVSIDMSQLLITMLGGA